MDFSFQYLSGSLSASRMKAFFAIGAIASLCQSAYCLDPGTYFIGSAISDSDVLTEKGANLPLAFEKTGASSGQYWSLTPSDGGYFQISTDEGLFINCAKEGTKTCYAGPNPQSFLPEFQGDNKYELVEQGSGYFLRQAEDGSLQLAEYDQSINEQFRLKPV